jgi:MFS family permease
MVARLGLRIRSRFAQSELPSTYWFLWFGTLINRLGWFVVPFLVLYLTSKIGVSPTGAALLVSVLGAGSFVSQLTGGELADRLGRRPVMLLSFSISPLAMITVGLTHEIWLLAVAIFVLGFFSNLSRPAVNAAVIDLVSADRRTRAFGYIYWAINLGAALGPVAAGYLANVDYLLLFVGDALTTAVFGLIVYRYVPETQPAEASATPGSGLRGRLGEAGREPILLIFSLLTLLWAMVYSQSQVTLPLAMAHSGLQPSDYGLAIAVNGALIVVVTLPATRLIERWPRFGAIALASLLLGTGFGLTVFAGSLAAYAATVVVWTLGEIIGAAVAPAIIGDLSPSHLRGLYQGIWGSAWGLAWFAGPIVGGLVYEQLGATSLWAGTFAAGPVLFVGFLLLSLSARRRLAAPAEVPLD